MFSMLSVNSVAFCWVLVVAFGCWAEEVCCWFLPAVLVTSGSRNESFLRGRSSCWWCCCWSWRFDSAELGTFNCWLWFGWGDGGADCIACCCTAIVLVRIDTGLLLLCRSDGGGWGGGGGGGPLLLPNQLSDRSRNLCRSIFIVWPGLNEVSSAMQLKG